MFERYTRLSRFKPIGNEGLNRLRQKSAAIIGVGALGTVQAEILVRSGIGEITLIDRDYVDITNLQRQTLFTEEDVSEQLPKAVAAKKRLGTVNQEVKINAVVTDLHPGNAEELLATHDILLDGTDNFETRLLINDISVKHDIPWIYGAATGSYGLSYTFIPHKTACFSCVYRYLPVAGETCETVGIIGPAAQLVASLQCAEALKILTGNDEHIRKGLFYFDLWTNDFSSISLESAMDPHCPTCQTHQYPYLENDHRHRIGVLCGRDTVQIRPSKGAVFDYIGITRHLKNAGLNVFSNDFLTQLHLQHHRIVLFKDGRALIHGTHSIEEAKKLYQDYIGG
ncbi:MAG: ThiF family adenylyltransferase [Tuberibacillus sp.]